MSQLLAHVMFTRLSTLFLKYEFSNVDVDTVFRKKQLLASSWVVRVRSVSARDGPVGSMAVEIGFQNIGFRFLQTKKTKKTQKSKF